MSRQITFAELCEHNTEQDLWLLIDGKVYDVTKFMPEHPGGDEVLTTEAGKDATEHFEDVGHSDDARDQLKGMLIGTLADPENVPNTNRSSTEGGTTAVGQPPLLVILAVLGVIAYFGYTRFVLKQ
ncbi:uncharacterized protein MJAP1_000887 [Malassezia japonica]|uniref:Cytochrome b5 heme-binding domain-containing protein n=1 Tax=Malassezia japonica TaxID=223818 RepID=A0AAF0F0T5_9BASI|nr:uncharacterized protein MJAP1_000887 [Malassezia japonica]WFD37939.1 hypothetical protein MJAP1_000887 [Malassezia japonica]